VASGHWRRLTCHRLPLLDNPSCGLGLVTKFYLDEQAELADPTDSQQQEILRKKAGMWFVHTDLRTSLQDSFRTWDAMYAGVKAGDDLISHDDKAIWDEVNDWLSPRRFKED
jgi:hypothetical protein